MRFPTMWYVRQSKAQTLCLSLECFLTVKLLTEHHLEFLSLKEAAQACLSLHMPKYHIVGNLMSWLIFGLKMVC